MTRTPLRKITALITAISLAGACTAIGYETKKPTPATCDSHTVGRHVRAARSIIDNAYSHEHWHDKNPIRSGQSKRWRFHRGCVVGHGHDLIVHHKHHRIKNFRQYRKAQLKAVNDITPFPGPNGTHWAIPYNPEVLCESGGNYHIGYAGAYGLITSTWNAFGGPKLSGSSTAGGAAPHYQDIIAHRVWERYGESAWRPYESGCAYG